MLRFSILVLFFATGGISLSLAQDFDLEAALAECTECANNDGAPVCIMVVEGEGVQVPNMCYAECLGFPTVGPWFCEGTDEESEGGGSDEGNGDGGEGGGSDEGNGGGGEGGGSDEGNGGDGEGGGSDEGNGGDGDGEGDGSDEGNDGEGDGTDDNNDSDGDGLTDSEESGYNTDANNADTDGDGLSDGDEVMLFNLSPTSTDTDGNGVADPIDLVYQLLEQVTADPCPSDINKDGMVTVADMLAFLTDFGVICD
jgi:hypothetical protein